MFEAEFGSLAKNRNTQAWRVEGLSGKIVAILGTDSLDSPRAWLGGRQLLGHSDLPDSHIRAFAACHAENVAVRRGHSENAVLVAQGLRRVFGLQCPFSNHDASSSVLKIRL